MQLRNSDSTLRPGQHPAALAGGPSVVFGLFGLGLWMVGLTTTAAGTAPRRTCKEHRPGAVRGDARAPALALRQPATGGSGQPWPGDPPGVQGRPCVPLSRPVRPDAQRLPDFHRRRPRIAVFGLFEVPATLTSIPGPGRRRRRGSRIPRLGPGDLRRPACPGGAQAPFH